MFDKLFAEFIDIIEWNESDPNVLVYRFPRYNNEIKNGAKLIVRPGQLAVLVSEGQMGDTYQAGTHTLTTNNMPITTTLSSWKFGFESPFKVEVYFFNTRIFNDLKWGTPTPIIMRDSELGVVRLRARGQFGLRLTGNVSVFLTEFIGTRATFTTEDVFESLRSNIVMAFADLVASGKVPLFDLATQYREYSEQLKVEAEKLVGKWGFTLPFLTIDAITVPPEVEAMIDKRSSMGVVGEGSFMNFQAASSLTMPGSGGLAGDAVGLGVGLNMANQMFAQNQQNLQNQHNQQQQSNQNQQAPQQQGPPALPPPVPAIEYFWAKGPDRQGPINESQLSALIKSDTVTKQTLLWYQGLPGWKASGDISEIAHLFAATPPPLPV
ncbi:MAG: SPFH domain-containing protein [Bacteroidota bacterium]